METKYHHQKNSHAAIIAVTVSLLGSALSFILNLILSRKLSAEIYGDYYIILQVLTITSILAAFGTNTAIIKFLPQYFAENNQRKLHSFLAWNYKLVNRVTGVLTVVGAIVASAAVLLSYFGITFINHYHPVIFSFWLVPLFAYSLISNSLLQGVNYVNASLFFSNVVLVLFEILIIFTLGLLHYHINIYHVFLMIGLSQMLVILLQQMVIRRKLKVEKQKPTQISFESEWFIYAKEMLINNLVLQLAIVVVAVLFEMLGHNEGEVGVFAAINTVAGIIFTISSAINTLFSPKLSAYSNDLNRLQKVVNKANTIRQFFILPVALICIVLSHKILFLFNPKFAVYARELDLIIVASFLGLQASIASSVLLYSGNQKLEVYSNIAFLISAIIFSFLLIPSWGLMGAISAQAMTTLAAYSFDFIAVKKSSPIKTFFFI